jgi:poly-D-alanine transfer protein DltD
VICQPINTHYSRLQGIAAGTNAGFYQRLSAETAAFHVPLLTFAQEGDDPHYFQDANHPSALMWLVYDHALDTFYHRQPAAGSVR